MMSIKEFAIGKASRSLLQLRKYSPEILTGVGIAGGVASAVMGAKATLEVEPIVDEHREYVNLAKKNSKTKDEESKALAYVYTKTTLKLGKLYGPAVSMGVGSIGCILSAHGIMRKRNAALVASYKVLETAFSEYRDRVREAVGEDEERNLYFGVKEREDDSKSGEGHISDLNRLDPNLYSPYSRRFEQGNHNWQANPEYNLLFLRCQQNYANDRLKARGHIFLNEVYDSLGLSRTSAGAVTGWVLGHGDDFVDFGTYDLNRPMALADNNTDSDGTIYLDFNVDGIVYDLI